MKMRIFLLLLSTLSLLSCAVGPNYKPPIAAFPNHWKTTQAAHKATSTDPVNLTWWKQFHDPVLNQLIEEAVANNLSIKAAKANIASARALRDIAASAYLPVVDAHLYDRSRRISQRGAELGYFRNLMPQQVYLQRRIYSVGFDSSWELDLFGQTRREVESQDAYLAQQIAAERKILITVIADVARNYLEFRGTQDLIKYTNNNIGLQKHNYDIINQRFRAGEDTEMDVSLSQSQWSTTRAQLPNLTAQLYSNANQLAVLLGRDPQEIMQDLTKHVSIHIPVKPLPIGLRCELLARRPDVFEAERKFAQSIAEVGVAVAEQYPKFTIVGNFGYDSVSLQQFITSTSKTWLFGPTINLPIFHGGALRANIASKQALADAALFQFEEKVLQALQDADTALVRYGQSLETYKRLRQAVTSNRRSVTLTQERYRDGEDDVVALITVEKNLYDSEISLVNSHTEAMTNLVSLYKALGGGWEVFEPGACR